MARLTTFIRTNAIRDPRDLARAIAPLGAADDTAASLTLSRVLPVRSDAGSPPDSPRRAGGLSAPVLGRSAADWPPPLAAIQDVRVNLAPCLTLDVRRNALVSGFMIVSCRDKRTRDFAEGRRVTAFSGFASKPNCAWTAWRQRPRCRTWPRCPATVLRR